MRPRPRPRCRSWLPLSTQQLRLRNLVRIDGLNIKCWDTGAVIYYTLHQNIDEDAFYLSEYLPLRQELKWAEIICPKLFKSNDQSVCVKVWARILVRKSVGGGDGDRDGEKVNGNEHERSISRTVQSLSAFNRKHQASSTSTKEDGFHEANSQDQILFTWGVYFSGLIPLKITSDHKYKDNSLIFHINGDYFTSAEQILLDANDLTTNTQIKGQGQDERLRMLRHHESLRCETKSVDICRNPYDARYAQLCFKRSIVRGSYNLTRLLKLQQIQRMQLRTIKEQKDISIEIQRWSMYCITMEHIRSNTTTTHSMLPSTSSFTRHDNKPHRLTMSRALSELFSEQQKITPQSLLYAKKLKEQLETLRLKQHIIKSEFNSFSKRIAQRKQDLQTLIQSRKQAQLRLADRQEQLQKDKLQLNTNYQEHYTLAEKKQSIMRDMERRMATLCLGLSEIYPIESNNDTGLDMINNVPYQRANSFVANLAKAEGAVVRSAEQRLPMALNVSLGYIAHTVQMIAVIINRPLRNGIIHQGSRSRIMDNAKANTFYNYSEFPLFSRSTIPSNPVKYAIFLLNQNVAQLCYDITGIRCDLRFTLKNIQQIYNHLIDVKNSDDEENKQIIANICQTNKRLALNSASNNKDIGNGYAGEEGMNLEGVENQLSKSHSSVDINEQLSVPLAIPENSLLQLSSSIPLAIGGACINKQRVSRSVGSYSDSEDSDDFKGIQQGHVYSNSDSIIAMSAENNT